jgi:amidase
MLPAFAGTDDVLFSSATEAAELVARREVSSQELTALLLDRIEAVNPSVNAAVELRGEEALEEAAIADRRLADGCRLPLLGVPMTVKEAFNVAGMKTTWGNPAFSEYVADADAAAIRRLKEAGAIIVGKTNTHVMLADFAQTFNDVYGATANPWNTALTPGGSSGGSAAATAAGMTFLELGSDVVGSIRIPASFCGVYGLRPSVGIMPLSGFQAPHAPDEPSELRYIPTIGPIARSAADLRAALIATAGPEPPAARGYRWTLGPPRHTRLADYTVGVVLDDSLAPVSSELTPALADAIDAIARTGAKVIEGWPDGLDPAKTYQSFGYHVQLFLASQDPGAQFTRLPELLDQERQRMAARAAWTRYFEQVDVFLCPTNITAAFPHDTRPFEKRTITTPEGERAYDQQPFWTAHAALAGLPAAVAPVGRTTRDLPVGAQILAPLFEDDTAITFAELLTREIGGYVPPPNEPALDATALLASAPYSALGHLVPRPVEAPS